MPSQLSTSTSTASSDSYSVQVNGTVDRARSEPLSCENDMQAATRVVGSLLAHSCNRKAEAMVSSLQEVGSVNSLAPKSFCNGDAALVVTEKVVGHNGHSLTDVWNGVPPMCPNVSSPKTEGAHSNERSSVTSHCNRGRLVRPQNMLQHANDLVTTKAVELSCKQRVLQKRCISLERQVREKQMRLASKHIFVQVSQLDNKDCSWDRTGIGEVDSSERSASTPGGPLPFPIQVDGASGDTFLSRISFMKSEKFGDDCTEVVGVSSADCAHSRSRCDDSFSSLDSYASTSSIGSSCVGSEGDTFSGRRPERVMKAHATSIAGALDPDLTDTSSDEEEVNSSRVQEKQTKRSHLKHSWEVSRMAVGSRWLWLQRKIAELNKQIYLLDHHVKGAYRQEQCVFGSTVPSSTALFSHNYFPFSNGSTLEKLRAVGSAIGAAGASGTHPLLPLAKAAALTSKHSSANGFTPSTSHGHLSYLPHLLLPEALLSSTRLHVKDLLSPSPLGQNLLCLDEGSSARTRPLLKRLGSRKVVRRCTRTGKVRSLLLDPTYHSHLSMPHELPSRILLDSVMREILTEHTYAQLPLSKRRRAASSLPQLPTPQANFLEPPLRSSSPSPIHTPFSMDSSRGQRKKVYSLQQQTSLESISTASTLGGSPWSPGVSRPTTPSLTPGLTPLSSARKKKVANSTPLFDIDNIVIPYSIASSTRLEKLEYKEIITPRWRKVEEAAEPSENSEEPSESKAENKAESEPTEGDEDLSDEYFTKRHNRSELNEKKRFLNFISGSNHRRRARPQSVTLSESPGAATEMNLTSPPQRRITVTSPNPSELELARLPEVLPWQPRMFPLCAEDEDALLNPPPPPPTLFSSSPLRHLHTSTPSRSPSCTTSAYNTPLASPLSTPVDDTPASSPAEWVVNSQFNTASTGQSFLDLHQLPPRVLTSSPLPHHQPIILKLTKKT